MAQIPSVRSTDQRSRKIITAARMAMASCTGRTAVRSGRVSWTGPHVTLLVVLNSVWTAKYTARLAITPDNRGSDAGQCRGDGLVASKSLDVGCPQEDEDEAGDERHPGGEQGGERGRNPRVERSGVTVSAEKGDELHDHDQRPGVVSASARPRTISPGASQP